MNRAQLLAAIQNDERLSIILAHACNSDGGDAAHDLSHLLRVALWTLRFAELPFAETVSAALLHDLVNLPKNHPDRARASEYSAEKASQLLRSLDFPEDSVQRVAEAIRQHSYSRGEVPTAPLARALQDADRLEAIGAIGLMRVFSTGARMGARFFHDSDPWAKSRELDDKSFSVDHFYTKLLLLEQTMTTQGGRAEARRRTDVLRRFLRDLGEELGEAAP